MPATTEQICAALAANPRQLTVVLARQLGVPEADVIACLPETQVVELDTARWEELFRAFEAFGKCHVICTNQAATLEVHGAFGGFSLTGPFFNVQTDSLDMHIRHEQRARAFAVEKPSHMDGVNTLSVQFFDKSGNSAFKVFMHFGGTPIAPERNSAFAALRERFRKVSARPA